MSASLPDTPSSSLSATPERILHRLDWHVIRRLDGLLQGNYHTLFYGPGLDFADLRQYQPEDDIRHIDWNVTARLNELHVRQYYEERKSRPGSCWISARRWPSARPSEPSSV